MSPWRVRGTDPVWLNIGPQISPFEMTAHRRIYLRVKQYEDGARIYGISHELPPCKALLDPPDTFFNGIFQTWMRRVQSRWNERNVTCHGDSDCNHCAYKATVSAASSHCALSSVTHLPIHNSMSVQLIIIIVRQVTNDYWRRTVQCRSLWRP